MNRKALIAVLLVLATSASMAWPWRWFWHINYNGPAGPGANDQLLTNNCGAKAELMRLYGDDKIWTSTGFTVDGDYLQYTYEYDDYGHPIGGDIISDEDGVESGELCMASTNDKKFAVWARNVPPDDDDVVVACHDLDTQEDPWTLTSLTALLGAGHYSYHQQVAIDASTSFGTHYVCVAYLDSSDSQTPNFEWDVTLFVAVSTNNGSTWNQQRIWYWPMKTDDQFEVQNPVVAIDQYSQGGNALLGVIANGCINYWNSTDNGQTWTSQNDVYEGDAVDFSATVWGSYVFLAWSEDDALYYVYSEDLGETWIWDDDDAPWTIPSLPEGVYAAPNVEFLEESVLRVIVTHEYYDDENDISYVAEVHGQYTYGEDPTWEWFPWHGLQKESEEQDELWNPSLRLIPTSTTTHGVCLWSRPYLDEPRRTRRAFGEWRIDYTVMPPPGDPLSSGRNLLVDPEGRCQYAGQEPPYVMAGLISRHGPRPTIVNPGTHPALALDGDGNRWVSYLCNDTVWTLTGDGNYVVTFAGSSSAVPGQPSIACHPIQGAATAANVVFAVYDTAGGTSRIMYARTNLDGTVLDTIESVNTLRDSLPCISSYLNDSFVVTYQHGDSVLSRLLSDYGPLTEGQPPAWSNANLVTASGYHPMSVMENGSVVNCAYTAKSGSDYSINRSTNNLGGGMFGNWVAMTAPSAGSNVDKDAAAYAGVGCSVWEQKVDGLWAIKGFVRGAETTLVANDTDVYNPYAVAESSAVSPSIDQVRVHLLYTAGVTFELDSGDIDTGDTRFKTCSLSVSNAGPDATRANNGSKMIRKEADDSLYAVYQDADGTVMYAYSAAGDSWRREVLATERSYPAIAADSTGKRWVVARTADGSLPAAQYLYYQSGGSWASQSLYSGMNLLGPASLAGASSTTTGIAYSAFKVMGMFSQYIVLTKYNGSAVAACTLATGANLGDPSIAVEPYKTDSDHVHVTWEDAGVVKYRMDTDGRSSGIANKWTAVVTLSDAQATSHHPATSADRDQIVAAWAQGATAEVYYRKRSTASAYNSWDNAANLSNTASNASDWPTIAMGDTVVVAWEETRSANDHDILACINFGDTMNVADNATVSGYPHILFQNKVSGDTAIPYLHCVWSETPSESYYEVAYNKLNLKQSSGEGQQSASSTPIPTKPSLTSCSPNPFQDRTQIRYALPTAGNVSLRVYDATGRTVRTLASGHQKAGSYSVTWDSRDNRGRQVPRGVYFYRLDTPGFRSVKKAVVAR
jgi:hypothetical protein